MNKKVKYGIIACVVIILLLVFIRQGEEEIDQKPVIEDEAIEEPVIEKTIDDPYGFSQVVDSEEYLKDVQGVRDMIFITSSEMTLYLFDYDILIVSEDKDATLIHNNNKILDYDVLTSDKKISYLVDLKDGRNALYTFDYDNNKITYLQIIDETSGLSWIDKDELLLLQDGSIYSYSLLDDTLKMIYEHEDNELFLELLPHSYDYIGMWVRVWDEDADRHRDVSVYMKKEGYDFNLWYKNKDIFDNSLEVESFDSYINEDAFRLISTNDDITIYKLDWDVIGIERDGKKEVLNEYAQSIALSPDHANLSLVKGEQDAWDGMYIYDLESGSMTKAVEVSIYGAPKDAIWVDDTRLLYTYGYPNGHFSIGGSIYEYNLETNEKLLVLASDNRQELFNLSKIGELVKISSRTHNEEFTRSVIDSFLIDKEYKMVENDPSILHDKTVGLDDKDEGIYKYFIIHDMKNDRELIASMDGYLPPEPPGSTFYSLLSLIALEEGVIDSKDSLIKWDGISYEDASWNKDQTLESAFKNSVDWYFNELAVEIGIEKMEWHSKEVGYGYYAKFKMDASKHIEDLWHRELIGVSAKDQVNFLLKLYKKELYFDIEDMALVEELLILEKKDDQVISGISARSYDFQDKPIDWFVGHVTTEAGDFIFASMISGETSDEDVALEHTYEMLIELGILNK